MLFHSLTFAVFFAVVLSLYWPLRRFRRLQNLLLLGASYWFYGWWDVRFLVLIVTSTVLAYGCALAIERKRLSVAQRAAASAYLLGAATIFLGVDFHAISAGMAGYRPLVTVDWGRIFAAPRYGWIILALGGAIALCNAAYPFLRHLSPRAYRRFFLVLNVAANLTLLGFFKYFNFFVGTFKTLLASLPGVPSGSWTLEILLPVGISFFVFQTMSYAIDVYRGQMKAADSLLEAATYVSFFPPLAAGPIGRASQLLPQFQKCRTITRDDIRQGVWLITWGLYQKVVVADNLSLLVNAAFAPYSAAGAAPVVPEDGLRLLIALYAYAVQIYCDFAGYTDMARGTARLLGFDIMLNFNLPYFARNPSDFWRRWHISLSTWLRDYVYIPLGGNRHGTWQTCRNLMLTMVLGGLWHGAAWTFVLWGAFHGSLLVLYRALLALKDRWAYPRWQFLLNAGVLGAPMAPETPAEVGMSVHLVVATENRGTASVVQQAGRHAEISCAQGPGGPRLGRTAESENEPSHRCRRQEAWITVAQIVITFHLICLGWLLFRAQDLTTVRIFLQSILLHPHGSPQALEALGRLLFYSWFLLLFQLLQAWTGTLDPLRRWPWFVRLNVWVFVCMSLLSLAVETRQEFIYFAF